MWNQQTSLSLIEDLQGFPCLWDVNVPEYKDKTLKSEAYEVLALKYGVNQVEIEKKIQALKNQFRREHKKILEMRLRGVYNRQGIWFGYENLSFLLPSYEPRRSRSTDDDSVDNNSVYYREFDGDDPRPLEEHPETKLGYGNFPQLKEICSATPTKRRRTVESSSADVFESVKLLSDSLTKRDEFTVYGEHIANKLRNCGRTGLEIAFAQNEIDNVCFNLIVGEYGKTLNNRLNPDDAPSPNCAVKDESNHERINNTIDN